MTELETRRRAKDAFLRRDPRSPSEDREAFAGLSYSPEDPALAFDLEVEVDPLGDVLELATSAGDGQPYRRYGRVAFVVGGEAQRLTLFVPVGRGTQRPFVPFRDATHGHEAHVAGRYLETATPEDGRIRLDFNAATHPYCVYSARYRCSYPPPENRLSVPLRAGERLPPVAP